MLSALKMLTILKKPPAIHGITVPRRRFTPWAALYFVCFFCLPVLGLSFLLDFAFYLFFTRTLESCYGLLCLLE